MRKIDIFDTTLRDGDQSLEFCMDVNKKLELAREIVKLGVDVLEAGFPASSPGDYKSVQTISRKIKGAVICGMARCLKKDIDICIEALKPAESPRINLGIAVSPVHMEKKLRLSPDQVIKKAEEAVQYARKSIAEVQFYAEDAFRSDPSFLVKVFEKVIDAGACVITLSDTVGCAYPWSMQHLVMYIKTMVRNMDKAKLSIHCHDDLGMATANSVVGLRAGADQVECTITGIGERAGNASLEEIVMALYSQRQIPAYDGIGHAFLEYDVSPLDIHINCHEIYSVSQSVSFHTGIPIPRHKAIVGENAYSHAAGIHQDGMLKEEKTYQFINPVTIGAPNSKIVLNARSGRHALKHHLEKMGYDMHNKDLECIYQLFLELAESNKGIPHSDLPNEIMRRNNIT